MVREAELAAEQVARFGAVRLPEDVVGPVQSLHAGVARRARARPHQAAVEQGKERLRLVPLRVVDRVAGGDRELRRGPGDRTAHRVERAQRRVDGVRRQRLLRALHGHDLGVPGVGEVAVQELESGRRLDVCELQVRDVRQAQKRPRGSATKPGGTEVGLGTAEVLAHQMRLAVDDPQGTVRRAGAAVQHRPGTEAAIGGQRRVPPAHKLLPARPWLTIRPRRRAPRRRTPAPDPAGSSATPCCPRAARPRRRW
jgi:hypothetical protein